MWRLSLHRVLSDSRYASEDVTRDPGVLKNTQLLSVLGMLNTSYLGVKHQGQTDEGPPSFTHTRAHLHSSFVLFSVIHFRFHLAG